MWTDYLSHSICYVRDQRAVASTDSRETLNSLRTVCIPALSGEQLAPTLSFQPPVLGNNLPFLLTCFLAKSRASPRADGVRMVACVVSLLVSAALSGLMGRWGWGGQGPTDAADWSDRQSHVIRVWRALGSFHTWRFKKRNVTLRPHLGKETGSYSGPDRPVAPVCGGRTRVMALEPQS